MVMLDHSIALLLLLGADTTIWKALTDERRQFQFNAASCLSVFSWVAANAIGSQMTANQMSFASRKSPFAVRQLGVVESENLSVEMAGNETLTGEAAVTANRRAFLLAVNENHGDVGEATANPLDASVEGISNASHPKDRDRCHH